MDQLANLFSHLEVRLIQSHAPTSTPSTPVARFQVVGRDSRVFLVQSDASFQFKFDASYRHQGRAYPHPYTIRATCNSSPGFLFDAAQYQRVDYEISVYIELKRLRDFTEDDLKRYYETMDQSIGVQGEVSDFHELYLDLHYNLNGNSFRLHCNSGLPIRLPKILSNPWTLKNTLTRFRYDAEKRESTFCPEMTLRVDNATPLQTYKIVLCLTSNTIPARMDYHALRWTCKLKSRVVKRRGRSTSNADAETVHCLSHSSGMIAARVYGPTLGFTPQVFDAADTQNYVRSCFEPADFQDRLHSAMNSDNGTLAILVTKATDFPRCVRDRRRNGEILRYLPFDEVDDIQTNLNMTNAQIVDRLKRHKDDRLHQLRLSNLHGNETFSQAHVRLHAAAYDDNDVLLAEVLSPPLRNSKAFEPLRITLVIQNRTELRANELTRAYCYFDLKRSKADYPTCPFRFDFVFIRPSRPINREQLKDCFRQPDISVTADYVKDCPALLEFIVPNEPRFDQHRVFIRLRHVHSRDYNPSPILWMDESVWMYYADQTAVSDLNAMELFHELADVSKLHPTNLDPSIGLHFDPIDNRTTTADLALNSPQEDELLYFTHRMDTPPTVSGEAPPCTFFPLFDP